MTNNQPKQEQIIYDIIKDGIFTKEYLVKLQRKNCQVNGGSFFRNIDLLKTYHKLVKSKKLPACRRGRKVKSEIEKLLTMKQVRSLSGIVVVSVLTKPYPCPGKCIYCPTQENVPKSYLSNEPAVMRAISLNYDPFVQTTMRLKALEEEGHPTDKINIRIIGGTWSYYPLKYRTWFVKRLFEACNSFKETEELKNEGTKERRDKKTKKQLFERGVSPERVAVDSDFRGSGSGGIGWLRAPGEKATPERKLAELQHQNETAKHRIVEISIETRQDFINEKEIKYLRKLGVTKVELGVQSIYDDILNANLRGHNTKETVRATKMLKDAGFKVSYQMMLNLYGANITRDKTMFKELFSNPDFKPDHLKIYPLALVKESKLYEFYKNKKFKPYTKEQLIKLLKYVKKQIPYYCRIERIIRDIPSESIVEGGTKFSNMRQILQKELSDEGTMCKCIRCREVRDNEETEEQKNIKTFMHIDNLAHKQLASLEEKSGSQAHWKDTTVDAPIKCTSFFDKRAQMYLFTEKYNASNGIEYFLSFENYERTKLYSLLRLRIPSYAIGHKKHYLSVLDGSAIIREIHTYGKQVEISKKNNVASQHKGLGKILINKAETITKKEGLKKISVISGVGVRGYFEKLGYKLKDTYMVKILF